MLTLNISNYSQIAIDFKDKYIEKLLVAINEKRSELGTIYNILNSDFLDKLLLYTPKKQYKLITIALKKYPDLNDKSSTLRIALKYIFIDNGYDKIDKKEFYNNMNIKSCIYCNRNYIFNLYANGHIKGQIDHFYDKATYPFLAMSFYNLIPSCESCNRVKGTYNTYQNNSINPYDRIEKKLFNIKIKSTDDLEYDLNSDNLMDKLLIKEIYNKGHNDIVNDMYNKFCNEEAKEHFKTLKKDFKKLFTDDEVYRYLTCGYLNKEEFHKRSHSKLIKDIFEEFNLKSEEN